MAGGRRPANYNPSSRHGGDGRGSSLCNAHSPGLVSQSSSGGIYAPPAAHSSFWVPSIWRAPSPPEPASASVAAQTQQSHSPSAAQLGAALDSAVRAAVKRALDAHTEGNASQKPSIASAATAIDDDTSSETRSLHPPDDPASSSERSLRDLAQLAVLLHSRTGDQAAAIASLTARVDAADASTAAAAERAARAEEAADSLRDQLRTATKSAAAASHSRARAERALRARADELEETVKRLTEAVSAARAEAAAASTSARESAQCAERVMERLEQLEEERAEEKRCACEQQRKVEARGKAKRAAAAASGSNTLEERLRATDEALALQGGLIEGVREGVQGATGEVRALKKLVESNLRAHANAENIVKEQVSLITKHVCVAMRQYTTRRIEENNGEVMAKVQTLVEKNMPPRSAETSDSDTTRKVHEKVAEQKKDDFQKTGGKVNDSQARS